MRPRVYPGRVDSRAARRRLAHIEVPKAGKRASPAYAAGRFARAQRRSRGGSAVVASGASLDRPRAHPQGSGAARRSLRGDAAALGLSGPDPAGEGASRERAGRRPPPPTPAWWRGCATAATRSTRSAGHREGPARPRLRGGDVPRAAGRPVAGRGRGGHGPRARPDRALLDQPRPPRARRWRRFTDEDVQALQYAASVLSSGFPLVAFLQIARVYGQALAQIADAEVRLFHIYVHEPLIREGVPGVRDGGGDGAPGARPAAAHLAADGLRPPALPAALHRAGRGRPHGDRDGEARPRPAARGDRLLRPGRIHALHRGGGRGGGALVRGAVRGGRDRDAPRRRARDQDDRRRGDDRGPGRAGAHRLGGRVPAALRGAPRAAHRDQLRRRRSTATATTSAARSTSRRAWSRARAEARWSSPTR